MATQSQIIESHLNRFFKKLNKPTPESVELKTETAPKGYKEKPPGNWGCSAIFKYMQEHKALIGNQAYEEAILDRGGTWEHIQYVREIKNDRMILLEQKMVNEWNERFSAWLFDEYVTNILSEDKRSEILENKLDECLQQATKLANTIPIRLTVPTSSSAARISENKTSKQAKIVDKALSLLSILNVYTATTGYKQKEIVELNEKLLEKAKQVLKDNNFYKLSQEYKENPLAVTYLDRCEHWLNKWVQQLLSDYCDLKEGDKKIAIETIEEYAKSIFDLDTPVTTDQQVFSIIQNTNSGFQKATSSCLSATKSQELFNFLQSKPALWVYLVDVCEDYEIRNHFKISDEFKQKLTMFYCDYMVHLKEHSSDPNRGYGYTWTTRSKLDNAFRLLTRGENRCKIIEDCLISCGIRLFADAYTGAFERA